MTFFDTNAASYNSCSVVNDQVETIPFLEASEVLVKLLDTLGSAFSPVKSDIQGNINKIRTRYDAKPEVSKTLQALVLAEKEEKGKLATEALLWLKRGLEFTSLALRNNIDTPTEEVSGSFSRAYAQTLSKYHSFLIRPIFSIAMKACPSRVDFYNRLADGDVEKLKGQMSEWVGGLENRLSLVSKFYEDNKSFGL